MLIVGAGPVGLALAADLGWRGAPCLVIEQGEGPADHPRATAINARSMEFMRRWGVADAVRDASAPEDFPHTALYCTTLTGFEIARIERPHHGGRGADDDQPGAGAALQPDLARSDPARSRRSALPASTCAIAGASRRWARTAITSSRPCTISRATSGARSSRNTSSTAAAATARSAASSASTMSGSPYIGYFVSIFVNAPELWNHHDMGKAALINFVEPEGLWRNLVMLDGRELYRFGVRGKEFYDAPDKVDAERHVQGGRRQERAARVHLGAALDRAQCRVRHLSQRPHLLRRRCRPPQSSLLRARPQHRLGDAVDLGWKLAATLAGWGGPALLEHYETERQPVGRRNVGHADVSHAGDREHEPPPEIFRDTPAGRRARRKMGDAIVRAQTGRSSPTGLRSAIVTTPPRSAGPKRRRPAASIADYHPNAVTGSRAPHAGSPRALDHRSVRPRFHAAALRRERPMCRRSSGRFASARVPLAVQTIADPEIAALYERRLVLVRPDGHVAWRGDAPPSAALQRWCDKVRGA